MPEEAEIEERPDRGSEGVGVTTKPQPKILVGAARVVSTDAMTGITAGASEEPSAPLMGEVFASNLENCCIPPDAQIAAGPNNLLVATNSNINVYSKGGTLLQTIGPCTFFGPGACAPQAPDPGDSGAFDPRAAYDEYIGRFWAVSVSKFPGTSDSVFSVALSNGNDATVGWTTWTFDAQIAGDTNHWCDYETLGIDAVAIYLTCNLFDWDGDSNPSAVLEMEKGQFINNSGCCGGWAIWDLKDGMFSNSQTVQAVHMRGAQPSDGEFLINASGNGGDGDELHVRRITNVDPTGQNPPTIQEQTITVGQFSRPPGARQPGAGAPTIDTGSSRLLYAVWQNGRLYTGQNTGCGSGVCVAHTELNVSGYPAISVVNDWAYGEQGLDLYYPSMDVNAAGAKTMVFSRSGPNTYAGSAYVGVTSSGAVDGPDSTVAYGLATYDSRCIDARNRWGDYLGASVDPDGTAIWVVGEYATNIVDTTTCGNGVPYTWWGSQVALTYQAAPPANDIYCNATAVGVGSPAATENTSLATAYPASGDPSCTSPDPVHACTGRPDSNTVWYYYQPASFGTVTIDTAPSGYDTVLSAYGFLYYDPTQWRELACNDDSGGTLQSQISFTVAPGFTYAIEASAFRPGGGPLTLNVQQAPWNDNFVNAINIPGPRYANSQSTVGATSEAFEPTASCFGSPGKTVWYAYSPTLYNQNVIAQTTGTDMTALAVWAYNPPWAPGQFVELGCGPSTGNPQSSLDFTAFGTYGTQYFFQVSFYDPLATGNVEFTLKLANDDCCGGAVIPGIRYGTAQITNGASFSPGTLNQPGEPVPSCGPPGSTVWYEYTAAIDQPLMVDTSGSDYDTTLAVYTARSPSIAALESFGDLTFTEVDCNDNIGPGNYQSKVRFAAEAGVTYYFQIGAGPGFTARQVGAPYDLQFALKLANDDIDDATPISGPRFTDSENVLGATSQPGVDPAPSCAPSPTPVWYMYVPAVTQQLTVDTIGSDFDTTLAVWRLNPSGALTEIDCNDNIDTGNLQSKASFTALAGQTYMFQLSPWGFSLGNLVFTLKLDNDDFADASSAAPLPFERVEYTMGASWQLLEPNPSCWSAVASVWFRYTPSSDQNLMAQTLGSSYNTELAVWTQTKTGGLQQVDCANTAGQESIWFAAAAGTTYYFHLDGVAGATGTLDFRLLPDTDGDRVADGQDNCPDVANGNQANVIHPATPAGDACEDPDSDGHMDASDNCPDVANGDQANVVHPATPAGDACEDPDSDGHMDASDNCPDVANSDQANVVHPATPAGDACEDPDADGHADASDNCPDVANGDQANVVHPATPAGDACEDPDSDGHMDASDNCPDVANGDQANVVHPATPAGDACEDPDADGHADASDNCPDVANENQANVIHPATPAGDACEDPDADGHMDASDNCPDVANGNQANVVHPATPAGDACEDPDADGHMDASDNCPDVANADQRDANGNGIGDACDQSDSDGDSFRDEREVAMRTDPARACAATSTANDETIDSWPPDADDDQDVDVGDVINLFFGKIFTPAAYTPRSDFDADGDIDVGDVINAAFGRMFTSCGA